MKPMGTKAVVSIRLDVTRTWTQTFRAEPSRHVALQETLQKKVTPLISSNPTNPRWHFKIITGTRHSGDATMLGLSMTENGESGSRPMGVWRTFPRRVGTHKFLAFDQPVPCRAILLSLLAFCYSFLPCLTAALPDP